MKQRQTGCRGVCSVFLWFLPFQKWPVMWNWSDCAALLSVVLPSWLLTHAYNIQPTSDRKFPALHPAVFHSHLVAFSWQFLFFCKIKAIFKKKKLKSAIAIWLFFFFSFKTCNKYWSLRPSKHNTPFIHEVNWSCDRVCDVHSYVRKWQKNK